MPLEFESLPELFLPFPTTLQKLAFRAWKSEVTFCLADPICQDLFDDVLPDFHMKLLASLLFLAKPSIQPG